MARLPVDAALRAWARESPAAAARAAAALDPLLRIHAAGPWQEVAWSFSSLTADGYPCELTFCSDDASVRWAAEVAGPEMPDASRLAMAFDLAGASRCAAADAWLERLERIQRGASLAYGAWIGGRHGAGSDRYKIYAEIPRDRDCDDLARACLGNRLAPSFRRPRLRMIGIAPETGEAEFYFRAERMEGWEIERILGCAGVPRHAGELLDLIAEVSGRGAVAVLPWSRVGFSLRTASEGCSVFGVARTVLGTDRAIRSRLLETAARRGWPFTGYREVTIPLAAVRRHRTSHGIAAFCADPRGVSFRIGVRPPPPLAATASPSNNGVCDALAR